MKGECQRGNKRGQRSHLVGSIAVSRGKKGKKRGKKSQRPYINREREREREREKERERPILI